MGSLFRGLKHLAYAILLIAAVLCVSEVALRAYLCQRDVTTGIQSAQPLILPSPQTYQQLRPLLEVEHALADGSGSVLVRTNSCGLRGPEIAVPKPQGVFRVFCLGDDATLALDLPEEETYCVRLEQCLQQSTDLRVEVVNAGLPGGCPLTSYLLLRHRLIGLQPDLILLHIGADDFDDDRAIRPGLYVDEGGVPVAAVHPLCAPHPLPMIERLAGEFALVDWARGRLGRVWTAAGDDVDLPDAVSDPASGRLPSSRLIEQALAPVDELRRLAASSYCELVVTAPFDPLAGQSLSDGPPAGEGGMEALLTSRGVRFVDAAISPSAHGNGLSAGQHDLYARAQADYVVAQIPGVWTRSPTLDGLRPLPGVARTPRGEIE